MGAELLPGGCWGQLCSPLAATIPKDPVPDGCCWPCWWRDAASLSLLVSQAVALHNAGEGIRPGHRRAGAGEDTQVGQMTAGLLQLLDLLC